MLRPPRSTGFPVRLPSPWMPVLAPARGSTAVASYLRAHLYGAAVGRSLLDHCIRAVDEGDKTRLEPLRAQFEEEIDTAAGVLARLTPIGTPGRRLLRLSTGITFSVLPVGPVLSDPLTRLAVLEALRTLVVAKRSMWELLADSWVADQPSRGDDDEVGGPGTRRVLLGLADQAAAQERLLEDLRRTYGLAVFE
ncbi:hypothetical protein [Dietzia cercidiphylli]|uniref:hypothetical protein n=1 Tax=Dietzia cercidiphylli TaxID=498199 RepID=UPI00223BC3BB|nr:hypothetical protein [Dietzia cercidiphylli]MCT1513826.1 hypothetical protein [Dietzia cercidiphylli]